MIDRVTILIVTWDGDALLRQCLESLRSVYGDMPSTVVVDNARLASTAGLVRAYANCAYVPSPANLGFAGGNNLGLPHCRGDYVVLLNNDTEFTADSLSPLTEFMDSHPRVGAVQGRIVAGDDHRRLDYCGLQLTPIGQTAAPGLGARVDDPEFGRAYSVFAASGAFLMVRRTAIAAIGGKLFRDEFKSYYEDVDLGQRLWMCGFEVWYCPTPPVIHYGSRTSRRFSPSAIAEQGLVNRWYSLFMSYHWPGLAYFGFMLAMLNLGYAGVSLFRGRINPFKTEVRVGRRLWAARKLIAAERRRFLPLRKITDWQLMRRLIVRQPWSYYLKLWHA